MKVIRNKQTGEFWQSERMPSYWGPLESAARYTPEMQDEARMNAAEGRVAQQVSFKAEV